jgi:hypothetical protein
MILRFTGGVVHDFCVLKGELFLFCGLQEECFFFIFTYEEWFLSLWSAGGMVYVFEIYRRRSCS